MRKSSSFAGGFHSQCFLARTMNKTLTLLSVSGDLAGFLGNLLLCGHFSSSVVCLQFALNL